MDEQGSFLPSKKFVIGLLVIAIIIAAIVWLPDLLAKNRSGNTDLSLTDIESNITLEVDGDRLFASDSDGDGLEDWEEALWGTSATNPDTDGNGISDGEEIDVVRANIETTQSGVGEELVLEDQIAQELFATISILNQGGDLTEDQIDQVATNFVDRVGSITTTQYTPDDLTIVARTSASHQNYGEKMFATVEKHKLVDSDVTPVLAVIDGDTNVTPLVPIAEKYHDFANELLAISVPTDAVDVHIIILNAVQSYAEVVERMSRLEEEPLIALKSFADFEVVLDDMIIAYQTFAEAFNL